MKFGWRGALGIVISVAALVYAFHDVKWADAVDHARHANYWLLLLGAAAATSMFPLRARRWRTILDPIAPRLPFGPLWRSTAIGMMVNNVVPLRAGEFARAYALTRELPQITFSTALASLVVDRVFDAVVVLLLLTIAMIAPGFPSGAVIYGRPISEIATGFAIVPLVLLVVLYALVFFPGTLIKLFELLARRVSPTIEERGRDMLKRFADGLSVLRTPGHFIAVFWWTLLHWLVQPLAFWLGLRALGIDVSWSATLFVQGLIVVGVSLPSAPGYFGLFESAAVISLGLYGITESAAIAWALVFHVVTFIPITLIGAYYFAKLGLTMGEIGTAGREPA
ncbi:MAG: lysylphosphatidylglycerol synthase transmembrane domain-containing protein [Deltaproteobacteria bacterium]